ncbi:MAG: PAS domain-containing protein, partial [Pseudomonadota bacterium]
MANATPPVTVLSPGIAFAAQGLATTSEPHSGHHHARTSQTSQPGLPGNASVDAVMAETEMQPETMPGSAAHQATRDGVFSARYWPAIALLCLLAVAGFAGAFAGQNGQIIALVAITGAVALASFFGVAAMFPATTASSSAHGAIAGEVTAFLNGRPDATILVSRHGEIAFANHAAERLFDLPHDASLQDLRAQLAILCSETGALDTLFKAPTGRAHGAIALALNARWSGSHAWAALGQQPSGLPNDVAERTPVGLQIKAEPLARQGSWDDLTLVTISVVSDIVRQSRRLLAKRSPGV